MGKERKDRMASLQSKSKRSYDIGSWTMTASGTVSSSGLFSSWKKGAEEPKPTVTSSISSKRASAANGQRSAFQSGSFLSSSRSNLGGGSGKKSGGGALASLRRKMNG